MPPGSLPGGFADLAFRSSKKFSCPGKLTRDLIVFHCELMAVRTDAPDVEEENLCVLVEGTKTRPSSRPWGRRILTT